jgi:tetratricopeptide (TPR) repeat protein
VSSDQVTVGDIPREPPAFQPRAGLLAGLDETGAASPAVHVLTGPPGTGKTQLAAAYARDKLAAQWPLVAWVNAGTRETLLAGLAAVAEAAGLPGTGLSHDAADAGWAVRHWLESDGDRRLLVFDGAEDLAALQPFLPAYGAARILITASRPVLASLGTPLPVDVATPQEAAAFLAGRTGLTDGDGAAAVAVELGHLPLALTQAATVMAALHLKYPAYLERLQNGRAGEDQAGQDEGPSYPPGAVRAVALALDVARAADDTGMGTRVMAVVAVLSAAGVRRELLHAAGQAGVLAPGGRRVAAAAVDDVLAELAGRSLLTPTLDGQAVVMYRLVAGMTRAWLARNGQLTAAAQAAAAALEAQARTLGVTGDRPAARDLSEQVTALLGQVAGPAEPAGEALARGLLRLRFLTLYHLVELGDSAPQAIAVGEPLTADLERTMGPDHPDTLNARNSLAAAYLAAGRAADAIPLSERTLVGRQRTLGPDHLDTLNSQNNLAVAYQDAGRVSPAILLFRLTLAARERRLGVDHPDTLNSRGNLAAAYRAAGRAAEAIPLLEQTLAGRERVLGSGHPDTQAARDNLDQARWEADQPPGAFRPSGQLPAIQLPAEPLAAEQPPAELPEPVSQILPVYAEPEPSVTADEEATIAVAPVRDAATWEETAAAETATGEPAQEEPEPRELVSWEPEPGPAALGEPEVREPETAEEPAADVEPASETVAAGEVAAGEAEIAGEDETAGEDEVTQETKAVPGLAAAGEPEGDASEDEVTQETKPVQELATTGDPEDEGSPEPEVEASREPEDEGSREPEDEGSREPVPSLAPEPAAPPLEPAGSGQPAATARGGLRLPWVAGAVVLLVVASGVAGALTRLHPGGHAASGAGASPAPPADAAQMAANWVSQQVSRSVTVGCDPLMCATLKARGVPTAKLLVLRAGTASPRGAGVVVATPAIRSQFGSRLDSQYAPSVIAGFGSGPGQVEVRVVAPDGAAAYRTALHEDQAARKVAGAQLLANRQIRATDQARAQLAAGAVDSRLLIMLPALAATHPIQILAFSDSAPGADPDAPLCRADLSGSGRAAGMADADYTRWLTSFVRAQLDRFAGTVAVIGPGAQAAVRVELDRPSPLGLLTAS